MIRRLIPCLVAVVAAMTDDASFLQLSGGKQNPSSDDDGSASGYASGDDDGSASGYASGEDAEQAAFDQYQRPISEVEALMHSAEGDAEYQAQTRATAQADADFVMRDIEKTKAQLDSELAWVQEHPADIAEQKFFIDRSLGILTREEQAFKRENHEAAVEGDLADQLTNEYHHLEEEFEQDNSVIKQHSNMALGTLVSMKGDEECPPLETEYMCNENMFCRWNYGVCQANSDDEEASDPLPPREKTKKETVEEQWRKSQAGKRELQETAKTIGVKDMINANELSMFRSKFEAFDKNNDGKLDISELNAMGKADGLMLNRLAFLKMFLLADRDGKGLNYIEFVRAMREFWTVKGGLSLS